MPVEFKTHWRNARSESVCVDRSDVATFMQMRIEARTLYKEAWGLFGILTYINRAESFNDLLARSLRTANQSIARIKAILFSNRHLAGSQYNLHKKTSSTPKQKWTFEETFLRPLLNVILILWSNRGISDLAS